MSWWHGGPRVEGDMLLPPSATGVCRSSDERGDFVFVAADRHLALQYAATCNGWLYEVEPVGDLVQDPDSILPDGESMMCRSARIIRRYKPSLAEVEPTRRLLLPILGAEQRRG